MSRPILVALAAAVLALVGFYATSGARNSGGDDSGSDVAAPKSQSKPEANSTSTKSSGSSAAAKSSPSATKSEDSNGSGQASKSTPASDSSSKSASSESATAEVPAAVTRALARDRTVVLFFRQRGSADDDATAHAVAGVRGRRGVAVFSAPISRLDDYAALTGSLSINQAPAVVIVTKRDKARLIEGYIDRQTLAQEVADAR